MLDKYKLLNMSSFENKVIIIIIIIIIIFIISSLVCRSEKRFPIVTRKIKCTFIL